MLICAVSYIIAKVWKQCMAGKFIETRSKSSASNPPISIEILCFALL